MKNLVLVLALLVSVFSQSQGLTSKELINIAGKQRMLSQRITKTFNMDSYGSTNETVKKEMLIANKMFQKNMVMIRESISNDAKLFNQFRTIESTYSRYNSIVKTFKVTDSEKLMIESSNLLKESNTLVELIVSEKTLSENNKSLDIINISGKQRMLQQRLASLYMAKKANEKLTKNKQYHVSILPIITEIEKSINQLSSFSGNTIEIDMYLAEISMEIDMILEEKYKIINGESSINFLYKTTNKLTTMYDKLTKMYIENL